MRRLKRLLLLTPLFMTGCPSGKWVWPWKSAVLVELDMEGVFLSWVVVAGIGAIALLYLGFKLAVRKASKTKDDK